MGKGTNLAHRTLPAVVLLLATILSPLAALAQKPGTTPVDISYKTQMLHGRKYYVHIVKTGQTVYSIAKAYKVESYDAVTHVDIHFLHQGDTVWLPCRGQFSEEAKVQPVEESKAVEQKVENGERKVETGDRRPETGERKAENAKHKEPATTVSRTPQAPPKVRKTGKTIKVGLMMPLHLAQLDEISTSKFDIEQRGKKSYRQFEFIEFYEGIELALGQLAGEGVSVELNVADVSGKDAAAVDEAFASHRLGESDLIVALLLRESFDRAAELARQAGVYIVNPMATRSELCSENAYMVKIQPGTAGLIDIMLRNIKAERPDGHLYIIHSGSKTEKPVLDELKKQLSERGDLKYTLFNWSQSARLAGTLKNTPGCSVISIYDEGRDANRVYAGNLLNRLSAIKTGTPTLYTLVDYTHEYGDVDFNQLQMLGYHTFATGWDMTNEVHVAFLKAFRDRYGSEPTSPLAATGYDLALYLVRGLDQRGSDFWSAPVGRTADLTQPLRLERNGAGLENTRATLYKMDELRLVPAIQK